MANRSYTARQDFRDGWNMSVNRYANPGAIGEMWNVMLDPTAHGALRQSYGLVPFGWTGTIEQWTRADASGRYNGICHISRLKEADYGNYDEIVVGIMTPASTITNAKFYGLWQDDGTNTATMEGMSFPFGTASWTTTIKHLTTYTIFPTDWAIIMGADPTLGSNVVTITKVAGAGTASATFSGGLSYQVPGAGVVDTLTVRFTHLNGDTQDLSLRFNLTALDAWPQLRQASACRFSKRMVGTASFFAEKGIFPYTRVKVPGLTQSYYKVDTSSSTKAGKGMTYVDSGSVSGKGEDIYGDWAQLATWSSTLSYWKNLHTASMVQIEVFSGTYDTGASQGSMRVWYWPHVGLTNYSTRMRGIHTVSNVVQSTLTPYGIWKSAGMNGYSYFYDGISTPFRLREEDPFEDSSTYSKSVGMSRPTPAVAVTSTTSVEGEDNVEGIVRYFYAYLDDEFDEGPLTPYFPNSLSGGVGSTYIYDSGVPEDDRLQGFDAGTGSRVQVDISGVPATVSKVRLYRTMKDRGSPYYVTDVDRAAGTITIVDTVSDLDLGDLPFTHGDPPPTTFFSPVVYYDRIWGLGTRQGVADSKRTYLFWTDVNAPESFFWDGNYAAVYAEDGDEATALVRDRSGLIIFKNNHTYRMVGRDPQDITFVEVTVEDSDTGVGCPHPNAAVATDKGTFFYWNGAIYLYTDGGAVDISRPISPILKGQDKYFGLSTWFGWQNHTGVKADTVLLSYDPKFDRLFVSFEYITELRSEFYASIPSHQYDSFVGATLIFDAKNGVWAGEMTTPVGFIRRYKLPVSETWFITSTSSTDAYNFWGDGLIAAPTNPKYEDGLNCTDLLLLDPSRPEHGKVRIEPYRQYVKFRPITGNLGPFASKRYLWVDYLFDSVKDGSTAAGQEGIVSQILLDGGLTGDTDTLSVSSGAIYSDRVRHVSGNLAAEIEPKIGFKTTDEGEIIRLFEYSVTWQNIGKHGTKINSGGSGGFSWAPM